VFTTQGTIKVENLNLIKIHMRMPYYVSRWWEKSVKENLRISVQTARNQNTPWRRVLFHTLFISSASEEIALISWNPKPH